MKIMTLNNFEPKIQIDMGTRNTIIHMANCSPELEFCIYCFVKQDDNVFTLTGHPRCPEQEVKELHFDVLRECKAKFHERLDDEGHYDDPDLQLMAWGHSHVDMPVIPSSEDADALQDHWKESKGTDYLIRFIFNKKGDFHFDVLDVKTGVVYWDLGYSIVYPKATEEIEKELSFTSEVVTGLTRPGLGGHDVSYCNRPISHKSSVTYDVIEKHIRKPVKTKKDLCHVLQWLCVSAAYEHANPHSKLFNEVDQTAINMTGDEYIESLRILAGLREESVDVLLKRIREKTHAKISKDAWKALEEVRSAI